MATATKITAAQFATATARIEATGDKFKNGNQRSLGGILGNALGDTKLGFELAKLVKDADADFTADTVREFLATIAPKAKAAKAKAAKAPKAEKVQPVLPADECPLFPGETKNDRARARKAMGWGATRVAKELGLTVRRVRNVWKQDARKAAAVAAGLTKTALNRKLAQEFADSQIDRADRVQEQELTPIAD